MLKVFDLFSGCGGFRAAANKAGFKTVAYCEINKYAKKFYDSAFNTKGELYFNDAAKIIQGELPDFDLLTAGFPCQSFSIAGKRQGFKDTRGTMFFEIARILKDKRPRYFILENVKGLLSHDSGKTFQTILKILSGIGIYSVEWALLNSKYFNVPQNRERVFIVGYPREFGIGKVFPLGENDKFCNETSENKKEIHNIGSTLKARDYANWGGNFIYQLPRGNNQGGIKNECPAITKNGWEYNNFLVFDDYNQRIKKENIAGTLTRNSSSPASRNGFKIGTLRTHHDGRGFREVKDGNYPYIPARAREDGSGQPVVYTMENLRRLTPLECFRLQGFSDEIFLKGSKDISDSQLYKLAGNSVTVNVVYEIMKKIKKLDKCTLT